MDLTSTGDPVVSSSAGLANSFPLDSTFGALLLGTYFSLILFGGIAHQTLRYYQTYPNDVLWLKTLVLIIFCVECVHSALCIYSCYYVLVTGYSNISSLVHLPLSIQLFPVFSGTVIILSQVFFVRRAYILGRQYRGWAIFVAILLLCEFAAMVHNMTTPPATSTGVIPHPWMITTAVGIAIVADSILTIIITLSLHRSRTGIKCTDSLMDILILYTITTGLLTSAFMLGLFVLAILRPNDMIYVGLSLIVSKLYANTLLAALNTRQSLRDAAFNPSGVEIFGISGDGPMAEQRSVQMRDPRNPYENTVSLELSDTRTRSGGKV